MNNKLSSLIPQGVKNTFHWLRAVWAVLYFGYPAKKLEVIGVTGTDGKTTTSTMLYHLLKAANYEVALISTVGAYIGDTAIDTGFHVTSPNPWSLQKLLRQIADQNIKYVVLEATSHGLDQHRLLGTQIKIGILTNITHEHLDYHRTYDRYVKAKAKLFDKTSLAVLNKTDASFKLIKQFIPDKTVVLPYSHQTLSGNLATRVRQKFSQKYNRLNATAAILVAQHLGVDEKAIIKGLKEFPGISGRMERIPNKRNITAIVDFAHTPNGLLNALQAARTETKGKLIAVYGAAGQRDFTKRPIMGQIGAEHADEVVLTAEDPRTESVWNILDQMTSQITKNRGHVHLQPDRQKAINFAVSLAKPGDSVIVLGKGHEKSMCFGKIEYPWSDQEALIKALHI